MKKICKYCGKEFEGKAKRTYCSRDCQRRSKRSAEWDHTCVNCGKTFSRPKRNRDSCQFCSRECAFEYKSIEARHKKHSAKIRRCAVCGRIFLLGGGSLRYCSDACRRTTYNSEEIRRNRYVPQRKTCRNCGKEFMTEFKKSKVFCSDDCKARYQSEQKRQRNHHRLDGIVVDNDITLMKLSARDDGVCQLCGLPVDWADYIIDDKGSFIAGGNYPSIDHIYPISRGGLHAWDNVQLAHFRCNAIKSDSIA